jgi:hypothetical protein
MSDWGGERLREDARWKHGHVLTGGRYVGAAAPLRCMSSSPKPTSSKPPSRRICLPAATNAAQAGRLWAMECDHESERTHRKARKLDKNRTNRTWYLMPRDYAYLVWDINRTCGT